MRRWPLWENHTSDILKHLQIVAPGSFGALQFYSPHKDRHAYDVQVIDRNFLSRTDEEAVPELSVDHFALTQDSAWLITLESSPSLHGQRNNILKFWARASGTSQCV